MLERLSRPSTPRQTGAGQIESIVANLSALFNSRQSGSLSRPDYGLPDFNDLLHEAPGIIPRLVRIIEEQIELFEPRLIRCRASHVDDVETSLVLKFLINGALAENPEVRIRIETFVGLEGRFKVRQ
ncbi:type VI secretion system baseplate subunit TssE [Inquilinus limosus]|uniref:type VI secretion system baseplate subunit TssE n=1 Tax=Inquilinus limosus TaxID=171674 RepID=UPI003F15FFFD